MKCKVSGQPCTIRAPLLSLLPTEFVARQVKLPASFMSTLLISKEAVPSTKAILYLSEEAISLPSLNQDTLMGREPATLQSSLQVLLTTLPTLRRGLVKNGAMSRSVRGTRREERQTWEIAQWFYSCSLVRFQRNGQHMFLKILTQYSERCFAGAAAHFIGNLKCVLAAIVQFGWIKFELGNIVFKTYSILFTSNQRSSIFVPFGLELWGACDCILQRGWVSCCHLDQLCSLNNFGRFYNGIK